MAPDTSLGLEVVTSLFYAILLKMDAHLLIGPTLKKTTVATSGAATVSADPTS